ncbi:MAG: hypothetical protein AB7K08_15205, partial [Microbacteriaceae bacterium]
DLEADRSEDIRLLAQRTRHDHRMARLQGLDPMEGATRWALWTARQAADRAALASARDVPEPDAGSAEQPPSPRTMEPVGVAIADEPDAALPGGLSSTDHRELESGEATSISVSETGFDHIDVVETQLIEPETTGGAADGDAEEVEAGPAEPAAAVHGEDDREAQNDVAPAIDDGAAGGDAGDSAAGPADQLVGEVDDVGSAYTPRLPSRAIDLPTAADGTGVTRSADDDVELDPVERLRRRLGGPHAGDTQPRRFGDQRARSVRGEEDVEDRVVAASDEPAVVDGSRDEVARHDIGRASPLAARGAPASADDALSRALRRRFAEERRLAERQSQRPRRSPAVADSRRDGGSDAPLTGLAERLAARIGDDLEHGGGGNEFAERVRQLSQHYTPPSQPVGHAPPSAGIDHPSPRDAHPDRGAAEPSVASHEGARSPAARRMARPTPPEPKATRPPRLIVLELLRYIILLLLLAGAVVSGWMLAGISANDAPGSVLDVGDLETARSIVVHLFIASNVFGIGWMLLSAWYAGRIEPVLRWQPFAALTAVALPAAIVAPALESGAAGVWSLGAMTLTSCAVLAGLRLLLPILDAFGLVTSTVNAWLFQVVATVVFLLASPLGSEIRAETDGGRIAFGVILVGLSLAVGAVLVSLVTGELEGALRGSAELARVIQPKPARSRDRRESSPPPSGSPRRD